MIFGNKKHCFHCGEVMKLYQKGYVDMRSTMAAPVEESAYLELYYCPNCRHVDWVLPITPLEQFEAEQKAKEEMTTVENFEYNFRDYTDKQLQKVIEGSGYVDDAKKAAQNLLNRRKYGDRE